MSRDGWAEFAADIGAAPTDFPLSLGPFLMHSCRIYVAINAFYDKEKYFPKPKAGASAENMVGLRPDACDVDYEHNLFCTLSPLYLVTLSAEARREASIPDMAMYFAWVYPSADAPTGVSAEHRFLRYGGFIYFDEAFNACETTCITPAEEDTLGLMFGRGQILPRSIEKRLTEQGRFHEITLSRLREAGARFFAWVHPEEFAGAIAAPNGCFAYRFEEGQEPQYYPVVDRAIFTKALVERTLSEAESFVVVRPSTPVIEQVIVFSKECTLGENISDEALLEMLAADEQEVMLCRGGSEPISYQEWQALLADGSTVADPWILTRRADLVSVPSSPAHAIAAAIAHADEAAFPEDVESEAEEDAEAEPEVVRDQVEPNDLAEREQVDDGASEGIVADGQSESPAVLPEETESEGGVGTESEPDRACDEMAPNVPGQHAHAEAEAVVSIDPFGTEETFQSPVDPSGQVECGQTAHEHSQYLVDDVMVERSQPPVDSVSSASSAAVDHVVVQVEQCADIAAVELGGSDEVQAQHPEGTSSKAASESAHDAESKKVDGEWPIVLIDAELAGTAQSSTEPQPVAAAPRQSCLVKCMSSFTRCCRRRSGGDDSRNEPLLLLPTP